MNPKIFPLVDAQLMHKNNPNTFHVPTLEELSKIKINDLVKICPDCEETERFWTQVVEIDGEKIIARIDNDLVCTQSHGLIYDDLIQLESKNIYSIEN